MPKEIPILFSTPMVEAILEERKTQTRRIMKPQIEVNEFGNLNWFPYQKKGLRLCVNMEPVELNEPFIGLTDYCPHGKVGNVLWVRETWGKMTDSGEWFYIYRTADSWGDAPKEMVKWKPSIFMPKDACRIRLEITDIRVERLQDINEGDAIAEGIDKRNISGNWEHSPVQEFERLWAKINGQESWDENPFVWVIQFKRI